MVGGGRDCQVGSFAVSSGNGGLGTLRYRVHMCVAHRVHMSVACGTRPFTYLRTHTDAYLGTEFTEFCPDMHMEVGSTRRLDV